MLTLRSPSPFPLLLTTLVLTAAACTNDGDGDSSDGSGSTSAASSTGPAASSTGPAASSTGPADSSNGSAASSTGPADSGSSDGSTGIAGLEIAGQWLEELSPGMGVTHVIDEQRWDQLSDFGDAVFHVDAYDNGARFVVAQGDAANEFSPELWSRFDWTWDGDALHYCTAVFDAATAADALAAPAPDAADLEMGCGGFSWSPLVPIR